MAKSNIIVDEAFRFKEFREKEGLSQEQMGALLGRTQQHIAKFEDGTRRIQNKDVKTLHLKLNMSYEWFYHNKGFRKYKPDKKTLLTDISTIETNLSIAESKIEQLDSALKQLCRDLKEVIPIK